MTNNDRLQVACEQCDLLVSLVLPRPGERAVCPQCRHVISYCPRGGLTHSLAFALAALAFLPTAVFMPFLALQKSGFESSMSLPDTVMSLVQFGAGGVAVVVLLLVIAVPGVLMAMVAALVVAVERGVASRFARSMAKVVFRLNQWNMAEVFGIAVIVSLVKIASMATVILGVAFWSYLAFGLCFVAAMANLDRVVVWQRIHASA